jgi:hypothetical protein
MGGVNQMIRNPKGKTGMARSGTVLPVDSVQGKRI